MTLPTLAALTGNRGALGRSLSLLERADASCAAIASALSAHLGRAHVVGLTGPPGAGKSTLLHALLGQWLQQHKRIAVLAVDPSSPLSGGALLGDRVRMGQHGTHPDVFIRSVAARGQLGGLARSSAQMVDLFDAAGFDLVLIETVGAGQSEVDILHLADTCVVACPPGLGDSVQALKAGILEIADVLVVSKADLPGAERTARELGDMLHLRSASTDPWRVPVLRCCASLGQGIVELTARIDQHGQLAGHAQRLGKRPTAASANPVTAFVQGLAASDPFARWLDVQCSQAQAGSAKVSLTVAPQHLNFNGSCHGGVIFSLADTAFGLASNSYGTIAVGIDAHITFQHAAQLGDCLQAHAVEVSRSRKLAVYRIDVSLPDGTMLASFTGTVYRTGKPLAAAATTGAPC